MLRKCVTFFFTGIVLVASFAAVYVLSTVQVDNQSNRYISFLISLCIAIFNLIITCTFFYINKWLYPFLQYIN